MWEVGSTSDDSPCAREIYYLLRNYADNMSHVSPCPNQNKVMLSNFISAGMAYIAKGLC